ncbi:MAG TPA: thioredoxin [Caulobacteraceae bacterium]|jgi:thioredoxin 1|nr:thioredoxin [Caulobacteraceae bacterium]
MADLSYVTEATFEAEVLAATTPVLVDFYADWCGPCRAMEPALKDIASEYEGEVVVVKLNVDENPATQQRYGVMGIPALLLFEGGEVRQRLAGAAPRSTIAAMIEKVAGSRA